MSRGNHLQDYYAVAAQALVEAYGDLRVRGGDKDPALTAAAIDSIEALICALRDGDFGTKGDAAVGRADLAKTAAEYRDHTCNCDYCLHATNDGSGDEPSLALTFDSWPGE